MIASLRRRTPGRRARPPRPPGPDVHPPQRMVHGVAVQPRVTRRPPIPRRLWGGAGAVLRLTDGVAGQDGDRPRGCRCGAGTRPAGASREKALFDCPDDLSVAFLGEITLRRWMEGKRLAPILVGMAVLWNAVKVEMWGQIAMDRVVDLVRLNARWSAAAALTTSRENRCSGSLSGWKSSVS
jgi:hypothetical protein